MKKTILQKIRDSIYKSLYKYTHSKRYRHNRRLWPHVKIDRDQSGQIIKISHKGNTIPIVNLTSLKNYYAGEDLMLIASGPSINDISFSTSPSIKTMGVNGAYSLNNKVNFELYTIVDFYFISQRKEIVKEVIANPNLLLFIQVDGLTKLIDLFGYEAILCKIALIEDAYRLALQPQKTLEDLCKYNERNKTIYLSGYDSKGYDPIAFESNITNGIFPAGTVVYWALQLIVYLGFKTIHLAGVDMDNFHLPRFYETTDNITRSHLELEFEDNIYPAFKHASETMKKLNVHVINMSMNSRLDDTIFEKKSYAEIFKIKNNTN